MAHIPNPIHGAGGGIIERALAPYLRRVENKVNLEWPNKVPEVGDIAESHIRGILDDKSFQIAMKTYGYDMDRIDYSRYSVSKRKFDGSLTYDDSTFRKGDKLWLDMLLNRTESPGMEETFRLFNRGLISADLAEYYLMFSGFADPKLREILMQLRFEIPPMSDLIRWAVRHAWDVDIIQKFEYLREIPTQLYDWAAAQGLGGPTGIQYPAGEDNHGNPTPAGEAKWFDLEWVAHWILPSAGQGYEMLHRLYPNSPHGRSPDATDATIFDVDSLKTLLRAQDIPPYWRDRLIALSYTPFTRVDIRRMYQSRVIDTDTVYHSYRANGYDDFHAQKLTDFTVQQDIDQRIAKYGRPAIKRVCKALELGFMDEATATDQITAITQNGVEAQEIVNGCIIDKHTKDLELVINSVKRKYVMGMYNQDQVRQILNGQGVIPEDITRYLDIWHYGIMSPRKEITVAQAVKWYGLRAITVDDLMNRLVNLGYSISDATMIVREANYDLSIKQQKALQAEIKQANALRNKQEKAAVKQSKQALAEQAKKEKTVKQSIKAALVGISEKRLKSWYVNKEMDATIVRSYLTLMGWPQGTIDLWLHELDREIATKTVIGGPGKTPSVATE